MWHPETTVQVVVPTFSKVCGPWSDVIVVGPQRRLELAIDPGSSKYADAAGVFASVAGSPEAGGYFSQFHVSGTANARRPVIAISFRSQQKTATNAGV